jgi:predicted negative regulator of RcsB-dependent stress response
MAASDLYSQLTGAVESSALEDAKAFETTLLQDYDSTPYAALGALAMARIYVEQDNLDEAEKKLRWAMDNANEQELKEVSRLRLAQVLVAMEKYDDALSLLGSELPAAYVSLVEELRGDAFRAKGNFDEARAAYDKALLTAGGRSEYLQLKRDSLGAAQENVS